MSRHALSSDQNPHTTDDTHRQTDSRCHCDRPSTRDQSRRTFLSLFGRGISCCAKDIDASLIAIR